MTIQCKSMVVFAHPIRYGTTSRRSGSTKIGRSLGGKARWSQSSRGQIRHDRPMRVAACGPATSSSEEHTSELQSLMRISYAVFCLKNKNTNKSYTHINQHII